MSRSFILELAALTAVSASVALAQVPPPAVQGLLAFAPEPPEPPDPPKPPVPPGPAGVFFGGSRSFLGVHVAEIDAARAHELKLKEERGVEITGIEEGSPAEKAGLKQGDVVVEFNGHPVEGTQQFVRLVQETPSGRQVKLSVQRGGSPLTVTASVATRKSRVIMSRQGGGLTIDPPRVNVWVPDIPRSNMSWGNSMLGIEAETVEGQLAAFFGVPEGALVRSVSKGSAAEKAGIKAGDVVTRLDQAKVASARELLTQVRGARGKKTYSLTLVREKKEMTLSVAQDEEAAGAEPRRARPVRNGRF